jgi:hypothetical protein
MKPALADDACERFCSTFVICNLFGFFPLQRRKQLTDEMRRAREGPSQEDKELARKKLALECSTRAIR